MTKEPRNLFFDLLIPASIAFVVTALAHALIPWENQPHWLQARGWQILLAEVGTIIILGLLSMGVDRIRTLRRSRASATMQPPEKSP